MPPVLRSRLALVTVLGVFLIPIGTSSLRGITHVLTCEEPAEVAFSVVVPESGEPTILGTGPTLERGAEPGLCGGLLLNAAVGRDQAGRLKITLSLTNQTEDPWQGTVKRRLGSTSVTIAIGEIAAGQTETDTVDLHVGSGTHEIDTALLIGP